VASRVILVMIAFGSVSFSQAPVAPLQEALKLFNAGHYQESFALAAAYIRSNPDSAAGHKIVGMDQFMLGNAGDAIVELMCATRLDPNDSDAFYYLGRLYFSTDNARDALTALERALALNPSSVRARNHLGQTYEALGRIPEAEKAYRQAIETEQKQARKSEWPYYNLGVLYLNDGRAEQASVYLRQALDRNSAFTEAKVKLAIAFSQTRQTEAALALLRDAIQFDPRNAQAHYRLAMLLLKSGKPKEAQEHFTLFERYRTR
jgi:tetratricopeptide (TPR) repeat protein